MHMSQAYTSKNFNARAQGISLDLIILHYTAMDSAKGALEWLCNPDSKVSCHILIDEKGEVFQLVDFEKRAWHAGASYWQSITDINSRSIGIELSNTGFVPYPKKQIQALIEVLEYLTVTYKIPTKNIIGHSDIAPLRKIDPGKYFPWKLLASHGFGHWASRGGLSRRRVDVDVLQVALKGFGYGCPQTGVLDAETEGVIKAFLLHFYPEILEKKLSISVLSAFTYGLLRRLG